jgi:hypothetical protein
MEAESFALSGLVIEQMWDDLKNREGTYSKADTPRVPLDKDFWKNFADRYIALEQPVKDALMARGENIFNREKETWSTEDKLLARYFYLQFIRIDNKFQKKAGRPSFIDLFSIYTRLARVAGERFQQQFDREATREEYEHMVGDESFGNMMLQLMMNSRDALMPVFSRLEGHTEMPNTDDTSRKFVPEGFVIQQTSAGPILQPNEETMDLLRQGIQTVIKRFAEEGKKTSQVLRCPVLYTGKFTEMNDWLRQEFAHHYLDQKYS